MDINTQIKNKAISGFIWSLIENGGSYFLHFIIGLVLVRHIPPYDYGLIGMITIFFVLGNVIADSGLTSAIIQKRTLNDVEYSTAFYLNIINASIYYLIIFLTAPIIADFYSEPQITIVLRVFALNSLIAAFGIIHQAIISKTLNYKLWAKINITSLAVAGVLSITMALIGYNIWALVFIQIFINSGNTIQLWIYGKWNKGFRFSISAARDLYKFSNPLLIVNALNVSFQEIYFVLIGKFFGALRLSFYTRAKQHSDVFPSQFNMTLNKVMLPVYSDLQYDNELLRKALYKVLIFTGFLNFSILTFFIANAESMFVILFTEKWLPAVPYFQLLCIEGMFMPIYITIGNILIAKGKSKFYMKFELIKKVIQTILIFFTLDSIFNIIFGQITASIIFTLISFYISQKEIDFPYFKHFRVLLPYFLLSIFILCFNLLLNYLFEDLSYLLLFITNIIISVAVYVLISYILKIEAFLQMVEIIKSKFRFSLK